MTRYNPRFALAGLTNKRQSTTAKVTKLTKLLIRQDVINGNGVIVRYKGEELGIVDVLGDWLVDTEGTMVHYSRCTIRKTTLPRLPMLNEDRHEHTYA